MQLRASLLLGFALLATSCTSPRIDDAANDPRLLATLWFQGAEAAATYLQAFTSARHALDRILSQPAPDKPLAIITDIDETVLDNSGYQAWLIRNRQKYQTNTWKQWTGLARAPATPGASNFLNYAARRGIEVFYVTNRDLDEKDATVRNLRAVGFPQATADHLFTKRNIRSKEERRHEIAQRYTVCLLLGDNLADFASVFDGASVEARADAVVANTVNFGSNWIVFPNPTYGDWESASSRASHAVDRLNGPTSLHEGR